MTGALTKVIPSKYSYTAIRQYAEQIVSAHDLMTDEAIDVEKLCEKLGVEVLISEDNYNSESSEVTPSGDFHIFVTPYSSPQRRRFTIAHELGHFFLHYDFDDGSGRKFNRGASDLAETQANVFAASTLMPKSSFERAWREFDGNVNLVAHKFQVSTAAAETQARVFGLI